ncbi:hypothetical protein [Notoacmeibacter sp. MSK16QG-6]|uniref:hypothetical protein n=1 Tax=Notoacmeibacter sp. MSK16QG-6 TaxID=2957982 RepID=UPI0020A1A99E|nr:hypothetical protein [Notoacmeibacter sp. MSK16QG-6]MCP1199137.1 hypothetical protein [Notoacmeibacter sp. MSK16QG-6]
MQDTIQPKEDQRLEGTYRSSDDYWWSGRIAGSDGRSYRFQHSDLVSNETAYQSGERVTFVPEGQFAREIRRAGERIRPFRIDTPPTPEETRTEASTAAPRASTPGTVLHAGEPAPSSSRAWWMWPLLIGIGVGLFYVYSLQ